MDDATNENQKDKAKRLNIAKRMLGRPPIWETQEQLDEVISEYFADQMDDDGRWIKPPTISGMALYLGVDRKTIVNYGKKEAFFHTIARARRICENFVETRLLTQNNNNLKFVAINNYDWKEKQTVEHEGGLALDNHIISARARKRKDIKSDKDTQNDD